MLQFTRRFSFVCLLVCLFVCLSVCFSVCLFFCVCLFDCLFVCLFVFKSQCSDCATNVANNSQDCVCWVQFVETMFDLSNLRMFKCVSWLPKVDGYRVIRNCAFTFDVGWCVLSYGLAFFPCLPTRLFEMIIYYYFD